MVKLALTFDVICECEISEDFNDFGDELAAFLQESLFNGEDVLEVKFKGYSKDDRCKEC